MELPVELTLVLHVRPTQHRDGRPARIELNEASSKCRGPHRPSAPGGQANDLGSPSHRGIRALLSIRDPLLGSCSWDANGDMFEVSLSLGNPMHSRWNTSAGQPFRCLARSSVRKASRQACQVRFSLKAVSFRWKGSVKIKTCVLLNCCFFQHICLRRTNQDREPCLRLSKAPHWPVRSSKC